MTDRIDEASDHAGFITDRQKNAHSRKKILVLDSAQGNFRQLTPLNLAGKPDHPKFQ
jgi:hypothetical protein